MISKMWKELVGLLAIFLSIWAAFSYYNYEVDENPFTISLESEEELAEFMNEYIMADFESLNNSKVDSAMGMIFERLSSNMDSLSYDYQIHVIDNSMVNAFTSLNGNIYIFTGLIEKVESAEELALVMAHEIGHAEKRHVIEKLIRSIGIETLSAILSGGDPVLGSEIAKLAISTSFDRENEEEADDFAMELALKSQLRPSRLGQFFIKIKGDEDFFLNDIEFIRTHPMDNDRIKKSADFPLPKNFEEVPIEIDWDEIQEEV